MNSRKPTLNGSEINPRSLGRVAVLMGGSSAEREVSLMSGEGVLRALRARDVDAHAFDPSCNDLCDLKRQGVARCFIALHGRHGEDGTVQGALELLGIPYTGSGVMASALGMDKTMTKRLWRALGLSTPDWYMAGSSEQVTQALHALGAPMIVKPVSEGSTIGLTKVTVPAQCDAAYQLAVRYGQSAQVLCEQFIEGEETTCAVLGQGKAAQALPVIRICAPGGNYDYQHKYLSDATQYHCPSGLPKAEEEAIQSLSVQAFDALGCRGWARADIMLRATDRLPFLLEINTAPGMTGHSLVPLAARAAGMDYETLCLHLLVEATLDAW